jgi:hypothetical protein
MNGQKDSESSPVQLSLVVPVFNEAETVEVFIDRVATVFSSEPLIQIEIVFVNDGGPLRIWTYLGCSRIDCFPCSRLRLICRLQLPFMKFNRAGLTVFCLADTPMFCLRCQHEL